MSAVSGAGLVYALLVSWSGFAVPDSPRPAFSHDVADISVSLAAPSAIFAAAAPTPTLAKTASTQPKRDEPTPTQTPDANPPPTPTPTEQPPTPASLPALDLTAEPVALTPTAAPAADPAAPSMASGAAGATCDLTGAVQTALQTDPRVAVELTRIPRQSKSVANALMLWDGRWSHGYAPGYGTGSDPLRQVIVDTVLAMSPTCRARAVQGPRLFSIVDGDGATVIALGSGSWRWADVLADQGAAR